MVDNATGRYGRTRGWLAGLSLVTALAVPLTATAQQPPEDVPRDAPAGSLTAEQHYDTAIAHFDAREWDQAAVHFAAALAMDPNAILAYNTARAYEYTGDLGTAEQYYLEALKLRPDADLRQQLYATLERVTNLRARVETKEEDVGLLEVTTVPPGATVRVNGVAIGRTPFQAAWPVGAFTVEASIEGYSALRQDVEIKPGREVVLNATLVEDSRVLTWVAAGAGFALIGGGIWLGIEAQSTLDRLETVDVRRQDAPDFDRLKNEGESLALGSVIMYSVGGVALASAVAFYFIESPEVPPTPATAAPTATSLRLLWAPDFVGVGGTF